MLKKFIGDKKFYKSVMALTLPIMIQNGITQFVNMLDNIMVGQVGTAQMTGVAVANQLVFVFNLCIFGAISGAGIFGAQFAGNGDDKGLRHTFRFKLIFCSLITLAGVLLFLFAGEPLINLYLKGEGDPASAAASLSYAKQYLFVMLIGLWPAALAQCYAGTLRETGKTVPPMVAGVAAVVVNLVLNYVLIFGHLGAPKLGVVGAAIATVISRFVELSVVAVYTFVARQNNRFIIGAYKSLRVPLPLVKHILIRGLPLVLNESLWAAGIATLNQCYSARGLSVVAANNICQTFFNVFSVAFLSVGGAIGIILGQQLGAGKQAEARDYATKLSVFSVFVSAIFAAMFFLLAEFIPAAYNTTDEIRTLASLLMQVCALAMPFDAYAHATYFTLRSGGRVVITFIFDCGFIWLLSVPLAFLLTQLTSLPIVFIFAACQALNVLKCFVGYFLVRGGSWARNLVKEHSQTEEVLCEC